MHLREVINDISLSQDSTTRLILLSTLQSIGYSTVELLLTPLQFGIPNSRLRYYLLAKKRPLQFHGVFPESSSKVWRQIPRKGIPWSDPRFEKQEDDTKPSPVNAIWMYLDDQVVENSKIYVIPDKVLEKWGRLFDIVKPSSRRTCCFTRGSYHA